MNRFFQLFGLDDCQDATPNTASGQSRRDTRGVEPGAFAIDDYRPMKVIVIGAGLSGILAGIRFRQYIGNLDLTIYEKQDHIGGTWYVNRYPGVACDVPAHCYQYTFESKTDWSAIYSPGSEILAHMDNVVEKYKLEPYIKLRHELAHAQYDEAAGKWHVRIRRLSSQTDGKFEEFEDIADFLFMGTGILSRWTWPDIEGLRDYKGTLVHSANWNLGGKSWEDDVKDWGEKGVAVIGLGSSALQIVSALQDKVGRLSQYARGRTWVSPPGSQDTYAELLAHPIMDDVNYIFTEEEKKDLEDPVRAARFRKALDNRLNSIHMLNICGSELQEQVKTLLRHYMTAALATKPEIAGKLIPEFPVTTRRLTPAPGYLKALCRDNVDFLTTPIKRFTAQGIETVDGSTMKHDVIICATGWDVSFNFPFPLIGRNGIDIRDKWKPYPKTYLSVCVDEFPNCFFSAGPNSGIGTSSMLTMIEHQVDYAIMVARKLQRERLKSIEVKAAAVEDFDEVIEGYFQKTIFTEKVRTWYKAGKEDGRVVALWPGSGLHCMRALKHPRWEDYNYERADSALNPLYWLGNGMTLNEQTMNGDRAWFLDEDYVDVPPVPE